MIKGKTIVALILAIGVLGFFSVSDAIDKEVKDSTISGPTKEIRPPTQPAKEKAVKELGMKLIPIRDKLYLDLDREVQMVEVYSGNKKLGEFKKKEKRFEIPTDYLSKAKGGKLEFICYDLKGDKYSKSLPVSGYASLIKKKIEIPTLKPEIGKPMAKEPEPTPITPGVQMPSVIPEPDRGRLMSGGGRLSIWSPEPGTEFNIGGRMRVEWRVSGDCINTVRCEGIFDTPYEIHLSKHNPVDGISHDYIYRCEGFPTVSEHAEFSCYWADLHLTPTANRTFPEGGDWWVTVRFSDDCQDSYGPYAIRPITDAGGWGRGSRYIHGVSPNGGERWERGTTQTVIFRLTELPAKFVRSYSLRGATGNAVNVIIEFRKGGEVMHTVEHYAEIEKTYTLPVPRDKKPAKDVHTVEPSDLFSGVCRVACDLPSDLEPGNDYKVRIMIPGIKEDYGENHGYFTITKRVPLEIHNPRQGMTLYVTNSYPIRWRTTSTRGSRARVVLLDSSGERVQTIRESISIDNMGENHIDWKVGARWMGGRWDPISSWSAEGSGYRIRMEIDGDPEWYAESKPFNIAVPTITVHDIFAYSDVRRTTCGASLAVHWDAPNVAEDEKVEIHWNIEGETARLRPCTSGQTIADDLDVRSSFQWQISCSPLRGADGITCEGHSYIIVRVKGYGDLIEARSPSFSVYLE